MDDTHEADKEHPEDSVKIEVEDVSSDENIDGTEINESKDDTEQNDDTLKEQPTTDESDTLEVPDMGRRETKTLDELDKKHAWLSELEEKCRSLETAFMSKIEYVAVSNHFQSFLNGLSSSEESAVQFRIEFANLFEHFRKAFAGSQQLLYKLHEVKGFNNITNAENRKLKIKLEDKDRRIAELQGNLSTVQEDLMRVEKEKIAVQNLFNELQEQEDDVTWVSDQETGSKFVTQDDEEAQKKINELEEELDQLKNELEFTKQRESIYQNKVQQAENKKTSLQQEFNLVKLELQRHTTRADKAEALVLEKDEDIKGKIVAIKTLSEEASQMKIDIANAKEEITRSLKDFRKCQKDLDSATHLTEKLRRDLDIREDRLKVLVTQKDSLEIELRTKQAEVHSFKADIANVTKEKNSLSRKNALLEDRCTDAEIKLKSAVETIFARQKELDLIAKELEEAGSKARELTKQKDALSEEVLKQAQTITDLRGEIKVLEDKCNSLEKELEKSKQFSDDLQDSIKRQEKERERLIIEIATLKRSIEDSRKEITRLELNISRMEKTEVKLRQSLDDEQERYKHLSEDERHCRRLLAESRREAEELQSQQTMSKKQAEQLQSLNQSLDEQCKRLNTKFKSLTEELGSTKESHKQEVKNAEELKMNLVRKESQEQFLLKSLADMEHLVLTLKNKARNSLEEKNVLSLKLTDREREITDLKENIRLLQQEVTTLDRSVNDRVNDIKLLKIQIAQISRSKALMSEQVDQMDVTRQELTNTQNRLMEEKVKSKTLEEEVQKPVNLHRWRILEGTDPEKAQLVAKNQALQKQLVKRMAELDDAKVELREKEMLAQELQEQLGRRRSDKSIEEQLWACKKELGARTERVKVLSGENSMFESLCKKYEREVIALKSQLREYKMIAFESRASNKRKVT